MSDVGETTVCLASRFVCLVLCSWCFPGCTLVLLLVFAWLCWGGAAPAIIPVGLCLDIAMGQALWFVWSVCIWISGVWLDLGLQTPRVE